MLYSFEYRIHSIEYTARYNGAGNIEEPARREVLFQYSPVAERPDQLFSYQSGVRHRVSRRLTWVKMYAPVPVSKEFIGGYAITYEDTPGQQKSFVESVARFDRDYQRQWYRSFEWEHPPDVEFDVYDGIAASSYGLQSMSGPIVLDTDGDGKDEVEWLGELYRTEPGSSKPLNKGALTGDFYGGRPCDVDGDGKMEILQIQGNQRVFMKWDAAAGAFQPTAFTLANAPVELADVDGDGRIDAFEVGPSVHPDQDWFEEEWFLRRNTGSGFDAPEAPFTAVPHRVGRPAVAYDLSGDGRAELHVGYCPMDDPPAEGTYQGIFTGRITRSARATAAAFRLSRRPRKAPMPTMSSLTSTAMA